MAVFTCKKPEDTIRLGKLIGEKLEKGDIICLEGSLGSGKTTLVKGIALALGIKEEVTSPTFTIISSYRGNPDLFHIDLYRIDQPDRFDDIGIDDCLYGNGIAVIEWGEKMASLLPAETIRILIAIKKDNSREIRVEGLEMNDEYSGN
ncbi:MAG: tRNA (adenosine(37)-N6)-threonylcarbamoyltransferase complex ATPase subunit type 1 TsaE [Spirochaetales bacterium]|nr:tRNA (adenosine(37)-N6)-threonylcarbamoyltransferase complex ATPase subunit type 1 TsaE [Spirochaetales bacterium]